MHKSQLAFFSGIIIIVIIMILDRISHIRPGVPELYQPFAGRPSV